MLGFFSAEALDDVVEPGIIGLFASAELGLAPVAAELRWLSAEDGLAALELDLLPFDNDELERVKEDVEFERLLHEPLPEP